MSQPLDETGDPINSTWCNYLFEFSIATNFSPAPFGAISHATGSVSKTIQLLDELTDEERFMLADLVMVLSLLICGLS